MHESQPSRSANLHCLSIQSTVRSRAAAAALTQPEKYQILAKKGFLKAGNTTSGLVLLMYSKDFQLGVLLHLPPFGAPGLSVADHDDHAFAKSAIRMILAEFDSLGVVRSQLVTYVIGGSASDVSPGISKVKVQRMLWNFGLSLSACDLGGRQIRSIWMEVATGRTIIRSESASKKGLAAAAAIPVAS